MIQNQRLSEIIKTNIIKTNKMILVYVYMLVTISTIFVYSATRSSRFVMQNLVWITVGTFLIAIISFFDYRDFKKYMLQIYIFNGILLLLVRFAGKRTLGAQRWLKIGSFQLQPSEFVKIAIIIILAYWITTKYKGGINNLKDIMGGILPVVPLLLLILFQPDLGTTLITVTAFFSFIFLYRTDMKSIWIIIIVIVISAYPIYRFVLDDYQRTRVTTFLKPETDVRGSGWHVTQSKISIGAGGLYGKGILNGSQSRLEFLPEAQTDFIFSVISEETGFLGSITIIILYFLLIFEIMKVSRVTHDPFGKLILYGISGVFFMHVIVNIGMTIGVVPVTGKPLLFLSYGGSSFISSFIMIGLVESIKINTIE